MDSLASLAATLIKILTRSPADLKICIHLGLTVEIIGKPQYVASLVYGKKVENQGYSL